MPIVVLHALNLVAALLVLLVLSRRQWFFGDEWEFLLHRGLHHADIGLFTPHNEHWVTIPVLVYRALFSVVGVRSYLPYMLPMLICHLLVTHLLWRISLRAGADPIVATAVAAVYSVVGAGAENLLWAFQLAFVGAFAFGLLALVLVDHDGRGITLRDGGAVLFAVMSLMFSGIAVTAVAIAGFVAWLRGGLRAAAAFVALPGAVYVVWLAVAGRGGLTSTHPGAETLLQLPTYIWKGLTTALAAGSGMEGGGAILVVLLGGFCLARAERAWRTPQAPMFAMAAGAVMLFAMIAVGRLALGPDQAGSSRYGYVALGLLVPTIAVALSGLTAGNAVRTVAVVVVLGLVGLHNVELLRSEAGSEAAREQRIKHQVLAAVDLAKTGPVLAAVLPDPEFSPDMELAALETLDRRGQLPKGVALSASDQLNASAALQVSATDAPLGSRSGTLLSTARVAVAARPDQCMTLSPTSPTPQIVVAHAAPMSMSVRAGAAGAFSVFLISNGIIASERRFAEPAGKDVWVNETRANGTFILGIPDGGETVVCGLSDGRR